MFGERRDDLIDARDHVARFLLRHRIFVRRSALLAPFSRSAPPDLRRHADGNSVWRHRERVVQLQTCCAVAVRANGAEILAAGCAIPKFDACSIERDINPIVLGALASRALRHGLPYRLGINVRALDEIVRALTLCGRVVDV